jgi:uncharacterized protein with TBP-like fold DUF4468
MKATLLLTIFWLSAIPAFCQTMPMDKATGLITYSGIVNCDSAGRKDIYNAAKLWALNAFGTGKPVAQVNNAENTTIVLKPAIKVIADNGQGAGYVYYTLTIECKDGKYKYTFTDFRHQKIQDTNLCDGGPLENANYICPSLIMNKKDLWVGIKKQTNDGVLALITDLNKSIAATLHSKKNDW